MSRIKQTGLRFKRFIVFDAIRNAAYTVYTVWENLFPENFLKISSLVEEKVFKPFCAKTSACPVCLSRNFSRHYRYH